MYSCKPIIHILAGEKVCIQVMTPAHSSSLFASLKVFRMEAWSISVGFQITSKGSLPEVLNASTIFLECSATWFKHSSPYKSCEPVQNQNF